jgi:hypothetical protein
MKFLYKIYCVFFLSRKEKKLFTIFKNNKKSLKDRKSIVLVQCVEDYYFYSLFGAIVSSLRNNNNNNIRVDQYIVRALTLGSTSNVKSFIISILFSNRFKDDKWKRLFSSYCDRVAFRHEGSSSVIFDIKALFRAFKIYRKIKTKEQLLELTLEDIKVGDLVYDSYLRFKPAPTVDVNDYYLCIIIWQSLRNINMTKKYFIKNKPDILLTSYSVYIHHGIAVRVAFQFDTKVYSFGNFQTLSKRLTKSDWYHVANCDNYKVDFENLPNKQLNLAKSESALDKRISGKNDLSEAYIKVSAYQSSDAYLPNVKNCVVVFLHDFFDSPHIYGELVFPDFLEWIEYTIQILEQYNISYFLKPHPNQGSDSQKEVELIKKRYPDVRFISSSISNKQLVDGGISAGISVYGSVAHELVYMEIPVVLCGKNPHCSYNFFPRARNRAEYRDFLKSCTSVRVTNQNQEEVKSFYYMHNLNRTKSNKELMSNLIEFRNQCNNEKIFNDVDYIKMINEIKKNKEFIVFISELEKIQL